jgi:uncharacterized protein YbjT (DUF2867 family)
MPVVVTAGDSLIGRAVVPLLTQRGSEVRAIVRNRDSAGSLRGAGAKVAVGTLSDLGTLRAVMQDAHTVCHLVDGLLIPEGESYEETNLEPTRSVVMAARKVGARRVLFVSHAGASSSSRNDFLRTLGVAEEAVRDSGLEYAVLRCTHVYGPGSSWLELMMAASRKRPAIVPGTGSQRLAPVYFADVAQALAVADDRAVPVVGTYGLAGPEVVTAEELTDLLAGRRRRKLHVTAPAEAAAHLGRQVTPAIWEVLQADSLAEAPDAAIEFGIRRTPLRAGLARR